MNQLGCRGEHTKVLYGLARRREGLPSLGLVESKTVRSRAHGEEENKATHCCCEETTLIPFKPSFCVHFVLGSFHCRRTWGKVLRYLDQCLPTYTSRVRTQ